MITINEDKLVDIIYKAFSYAYCDNCEQNLDSDLCETCYRKYINWSASKEYIKNIVNSIKD